MDLKKFKDFKKEKFTEKLKLEKFIKNFIVGKKYVKEVLEQQSLYLNYNNKNCIGFIDQDKEDYGVGLIIKKDGVRKKLIPVYLYKDNVKTDYNYVDYSFVSKEVSNGVKDVLKQMPYYLLFDVKWIIMVSFESKQEAIDFLKKNQDYSEIQEKKLREFEIRDLLKSGQINELKKRMIIQFSE